MSDVVQEAAVGLPAADRPLEELHDAALLDLDGVVYIGPHAVPGAAEALDAVRAAGLKVRFVTNNASRSAETVANHLTELGVPATADEVVTSSAVAAAILARRLPAGAGVLIVGGAGLRQAIADVGLTPMDTVDERPQAVVQGFGPDLAWRNLAEAARGVREGLFWMATNLDLTFPTVHGPAPGNGSLVMAVRNAAGRGPDDVAGKPQPGAFREAARTAGAIHPIVVGDRLDTDIEGAQAASMPSLLVLTGVTDVTTLLAAPPHLRPTYVGRDLGSLREAHPAASLVVPDGTAQDGVGQDGVVAVCRQARVRVDPAGGRPAVRVVSAGGDAVDLLRAAAVAAWQAADGATAGATAGADAVVAGTVDPGDVIEAVRALDPAAGWAR